MSDKTVLQTGAEIKHEYFETVKHSLQLLTEIREKIMKVMSHLIHPCPSYIQQAHHLHEKTI
jgi:predicted translin family RNA/ssDNA-binding protein